MTFGEYIDLDTFVGKTEDLHKAMGVLYRPITKEQGNKYDIEPYNFDVHSLNAKKFEGLSINIGNPIAVFFWNLGKKLLDNFHQSSKEVEKNQSVQTMVGSV